MKKIIAAALLALLLCAMVAVSAAAETTDNETTMEITRENGQTVLTPSQEETCFWEYPQLTAGQHRDDGVLWLFNKTGKDITVTLSQFRLPTDNEQARAYLQALHLTIKAANKTVFDDTYDKAGDLAVTVEVQSGEKVPVYYELGCAFDYTGDATLGDEVITGTYIVEYLRDGIFYSWEFYAAVAVGIAVIAVVVAVAKKNKKSA